MGLVIVIEPHGTYAIYEQIVNQIKNQIISGELQPDEALPSIRGLAADIGVSVITTKHAYEELEREVEWIASISPEIPLHLSRFFPRYKVDDLPPTPAETIYRLKDIAEKKLKYVYTGNL